MKLFTLLLSLFLFSSVYADEMVVNSPDMEWKNETELERKYGVPNRLLMFQVSPGKNNDSSQVNGAELQINKRITESTALGFNIMLQDQSYNDLELLRWGIGGSLNYYKKLKTMTPYIGVKGVYYGGMGKTQDALSCMYCSNVIEKYDGMESFAIVGINFGDYIVQLDKRISNRGSSFTESANDPWGVGTSYYNNYDNIPDPDIIFSIGIPW